jgi:molybdopterin/thiamine biosynthesis adenylyltransferase
MPFNDLIAHEFSRAIGLVSEEDMKLLLQTRVAIAGCGGVGGIHALTLARMGLGRFHLADLDTFERANISRQFGAFHSTLDRHKAEVLAQMVTDINPHADIRIFDQGVTEGNVEEFLEGSAVYVDGMEFFEFDIRRLLFNTARRLGIPAVTAAPLGFGATLQVFSPTGMSFDEYFGIRDGMSYEEKIAAFAVGLAPRPYHSGYLDFSKVSFEERRGPAVAPACTLAAALVASEVVKIVTGRGKVKAVPHYLQIDLMLRKLRTGRVWGGGMNPLQILKRKIALRMLRREIQ